MTKLKISTPTISVVVCTRNRGRALTKALECLERVRFERSRCELVVVNNGSTDDTAAVLESAQAMSSWNMTIVHEQRPGLGLARNAGVAAATGEIVAFTDDDCYVAEDYLDRLADAFEDSAIGYIGGRIVLHDPTDAPITIKPETEGSRIPPQTFFIPGVMHGANLAARRSLILSVGGFDPLFGPGQPFICDDIDFLVRASLSGSAGAYVPEVVVAHHHGRKPGPAVDGLGRVYAHGRGAYYAKFLLNPTSRRRCAQSWYWSSLVKIRKGNLVPIVQELRGAIHYVLRQRTLRARSLRQTLPAESVS